MIFPPLSFAIQTAAPWGGCSVQINKWKVILAYTQYHHGLQNSKLANKTIAFFEDRKKRRHQKKCFLSKIEKIVGQHFI
ncbi:hypothetical protein LX64_01256 [Chitinophaga skermanii]|uniref:Uncharacterized protein n=1 Tax=Chitinophaga skermanii TaxID=331697 RepID=A0A327QYV1_9BACT|nr:hypothetical protein LX64_01256 [Chitinophaga skermanii]